MSNSRLAPKPFSPVFREAKAQRLLLPAYRSPFISTFSFSQTHWTWWLYHVKLCQ